MKEKLESAISPNIYQLVGVWGDIFAFKLLISVTVFDISKKEKDSMDFEPPSRRGPQRFSCRAPGRVRAQSLDFPCNVVDISESGAKIRLDASLSVIFRDPEWGLVIEGIGYLTVKKVWQRGMDFGLAFMHAPGRQDALKKRLGELEKDGILSPLER